RRRLRDAVLLPLQRKHAVRHVRDHERSPVHADRRAGDLELRPVPERGVRRARARAGLDSCGRGRRAQPRADHRIQEIITEEAQSIATATSGWKLVANEQNWTGYPTVEGGFDYAPNAPMPADGILTLMNLEPKS